MVPCLSDLLALQLQRHSGTILYATIYILSLANGICVGEEGCPLCSTAKEVSSRLMLRFAVMCAKPAVCACASLPPASHHIPACVGIKTVRAREAQL